MIHVIWDLDGTLINSENEVLQALISAVRKAGLSESDQIKPFRVGPTVDKILEYSLPKSILTDIKKTEIVKNFRDLYDNCGFNNTLCFSGIEEILNEKRFLHHSITNKPDLATKRILRKLGWDNKFATVITPYSFMKSSEDKRKTKTELFKICMQNYPNEAFVGIGDMETDAKSAKENNILSIGVLWGTGTKSELKDAACSYIAESVEELHSYLVRLL